MRGWVAGLLLVQGSLAADTAGPGSIEWDQAFQDRSGARPIHFVARYVDGRGGAHRLEEWRVGTAHLRRRTDDRIDLHADAAGRAAGHGVGGQPVDYIWQIIDLEKKIDHRVSGGGMLRAGMLYSYYAMAHVLERPAGEIAVREVPGLEPVAWHGVRGRWFEIDAAGQRSARVCWLEELGVPLRTEVESGGRWQRNFDMERLETGPLPAGVFAVNLRGLQVRNVDEMQTDD